MDCALHRCGVTFVLDRAGVTGDDGASHNGMWDMSVLQVVPGPAARRARATRPGCASCSTRRWTSTTPRPSSGSRRARRPTTSRRSTGSGGVDVLLRNGTRDVLIVGVGAMAATAVDVGPAAGRPGHRCHRRRPALGEAGRPGAGRPRPRPPARRPPRGQRPGRWRAARSCCRPSTTTASTTPFRLHGIPQEFLGHAKRAVILERIGLDAQSPGPRHRGGRNGARRGSFSRRCRSRDLSALVPLAGSLLAGAGARPRGRLLRRRRAARRATATGPGTGRVRAPTPGSPPRPRAPAATSPAR